MQDVRVVILREALFILAACFCLSPVAAAQELLPTVPPSPAAEIDLSNVIVPITDVKPDFSLNLLRSFVPEVGAKASFGTGFCLDPECSFIVTNYHVAAMARPKKIKGDPVIWRYLDTGSEDDRATLNMAGGQPMIYSVNHDLALFKLWKPLRHHHGLGYSLDELEIGQPVDIYAYPLEGINVFRKLLRFPGTFQGPTQSGLLAFSYQPAGENRISGGASGGIVVDRKSSQIVGILSGAGNSKAPIAVAVPTQSLVEFVSRVQPFLANRIFPSSKEVPPSAFAGDLYPEFVPPHVDALQHRPKEPEDITQLRSKAQTAADAMENFIAVGTFDWGSGNNEPLVAGEQYEIRVIDGEQRFRKYPDGKKELAGLPILHFAGGGSVYLVGQWANLLRMVGTEYRLKIHRAADAVAHGRRIRVFQYYASSEDGLCSFQPFDDYLAFIVKAKITYPPCYGEVWTDEDTNIIRMSENYDLSAHLRDYKGWTTSQTVLTYGWTAKPDQPRQLVPWTFFVQGQNGRHVYWNRGSFRNYQEFNAKARIVRAQQ